MEDRSQGSRLGALYYDQPPPYVYVRRERGHSAAVGALRAHRRSRRLHRLVFYIIGLYLALQRARSLAAVVHAEVTELLSNVIYQHRRRAGQGGRSPRKESPLGRAVVWRGWGGHWRGAASKVADGAGGNTPRLFSAGMPAGFAGKRR